jgi:hypothetical protein
MASPWFTLGSRMAQAPIAGHKIDGFTKGINALSRKF